MEAQNLLVKDGEPVSTVEATAEKKTLVAQSEDAQAWELVQRKAKAYANSPLVPEHLRKTGDGVANCIIALEMAQLLEESPLVVMQNIYFVSGKAGWNATYMIARANKSGLFKDPIDWEISGEGDSLKVTAYAHTKSTGKRVAATVSMEMAKAEGWTKNSKYKSMPEQMLCYRSATLFIRRYCPQVMLGMQTTDELQDLKYAEVERTEVFDMPEVTKEAPKMPELSSQKQKPLDTNDPEANARREADAALANQDSEP